MAMQQQLPYVSILRARHPDLWKAIFYQQLEQVFGIAPVVLLLPDARGPNFCGVSHPQFEAQLGQQALEPTGVPRGFHPHSHLDAFLLQLTVEPFGFSIAVHQLLLATFPALRVHPGDLLYAWVITATYNKHLGSFPSEPLVVGITKSTQVGGADAFMKSNMNHAQGLSQDVFANVADFLRED
jgi:hypothetical protein